MGTSNFERLIQLAEDVFAVKSDPEQLDVDEEVIERLKTLHLSTVSEYSTDSGPAAWVLLIPTTLNLMQKFISKQITEKQILELTPANTLYDTLYLCSALTLPEYRNKGVTKKLTLDAIKNIERTHPIKTLFVWPFSNEGEHLADSIAKAASHPLLKRDH